MLFKRPFAFLIKHFKAIHLTLAIMIIYILLKTNNVFRFIAEYMSAEYLTVRPNIVSSLFHTTMIVAIIGILILTLIILGLMRYKKKPVRFYILNLFIYGFVTFTFLYSYVHFQTLEVSLLSIRTLKLIRDFNIFSLILQSLSLITVGIRATGFNIKKFDFDQDIEDLKITSEDNAEFEIDVDLDTDELKRSIRKRIRHAKYVYAENKFFIQTIASLSIALICFILYLNLSVYRKIYKQNMPFSTTEYILNIKNRYITSKDYHNRELNNGKKLLIIVYQVRTEYPVNKKQFQPERFILEINDDIYHDTDRYTNQTYDIGSNYKEEYVTTNFKDYILTYELPEKLNTNKIKLKYKDRNNKEVTIDIQPTDDSKKTTVVSKPLGESIKLENNIFKNSQLIIQQYEFSDTFTYDYEYCVYDECFTNVEKIQPTVGSYEKTLLKITGNIELSQENKQSTDLYTILRDFGIIHYEINGEKKSVNISKQIKPSKNTINNVYYIEVPKELTYANKITISLTFREYVYEIVVK